MKQRMLSAVAAILCTLILFSAGAAPVHAYAPPSEGHAVVLAEQVRWYYRIHNGEKQMRLWSITYGEWMTDWVHCPY